MTGTDSFLSRTKQAVAKARFLTETLLDLADVPDNHSVERTARHALISLSDAVDRIPKVARNVAAINDTGPVVFPIAGRDPRDWPTSEGRSAREAILAGSRRTPRMASSTAVLAATKTASSRRVMSSREYLEALEQARPVQSTITANEKDDSFSLITLEKVTT